MAETGKKTEAGFPIQTNTSMPTPVHGNPPHVDLQSTDESGKTKVYEESHHLTDEGHLSMGREAYPETSKKNEAADEMKDEPVEGEADEPDEG